MSSKTRVYIGNVSGSTREQDIEEAFRKFGRIDHVSVKQQFAFVHFADSRDAEDAVRDMDGANLCGNRIRVEFCRGGGRESSSRSSGSERSGSRHRTDLTVIVDNLPEAFSWQDLKDLFRRHVHVQYTNIIKDREGAYGIVQFDHVDDMDRAIRKLDREVIDGRTIRVKEEKRRESRDSRRRSRSPYERRRSRSRSRDRDNRRRSRSRSFERRRDRDDTRRSDREPRRSRSRSPAQPRRDASPVPTREEAQFQDNNVVADQWGSASVQ